ncbi:hypothetical protein [Sneathia sanguinegens]|jgi:hypothetical protein|uniref:Uncharacterized protein n=1 Tax=Sneathia sanguinegens TaxID=40543 RepID=A0ABT7HLL5_9FUSO|nr:hypothetical protein [Sneathia sanguinegens]MDK9580915.1 hypothetical protein [Sneathia sanguinegens]MDU4651984.1 hypothetical protein [Sneathia sanguinegens]
MTFVFIFLLSCISIYIIYLIYVYAKMNAKENLVINKDLAILNNKYVINFKDAKIMKINTMRIITEKSTNKSAIIDLDISIYTENTMVNIREYKHAIKIISLIKKYNEYNFENFLNKFFSLQPELKLLLESELNDENTGL